MVSPFTRTRKKFKTRHKPESNFWLPNTSLWHNLISLRPDTNLILILKLQVTHDVLERKDEFGQTLLTLIEINRVSLQESLIIVIRKELDLHNNELHQAEKCLRNSLDSSISTYEIVSLLHQQVPKTTCERIYRWFFLVLFSVLTGVVLTVIDIYSDISLSTEYYKNMTNPTEVKYLHGKCINFTVY